MIVPAKKFLSSFHFSEYYENISINMWLVQILIIVSWNHDSTYTFAPFLSKSRQLNSKSVCRLILFPKPSNSGIIVNKKSRSRFYLRLVCNNRKRAHKTLTLPETCCRDHGSGLSETLAAVNHLKIPRCPLTATKYYDE